MTLAFVGAASATTIEFDLTGVYYKWHREYQINIKTLNAALKKEGLDGLPERVVVGENASRYGRLLINRINAAEKALVQEYSFVIEYGYFYEFPKMCYRGSNSDVPKILEAMTGTFLNNEQGVLAIRYKNKTFISDENFNSEEKLNEAYEGGNDETKAWLNYDQRSNKVLVMSNLGPQGDGLELYATVIEECE